MDRFGQARRGEDRNGKDWYGKARDRNGGLGFRTTRWPLVADEIGQNGPDWYGKVAHGKVRCGLVWIKEDTFGCSFCFFIHNPQGLVVIRWTMLKRGYPNSNNLNFYSREITKT